MWRNSLFEKHPSSLLPQIGPLAVGGCPRPSVVSIIFPFFPAAIALKSTSMPQELAFIPSSVGHALHLGASLGDGAGVTTPTKAIRTQRSSSGEDCGTAGARRSGRAVNSGKARGTNSGTGGECMRLLSDGERDSIPALSI